MFLFTKHKVKLHLHTCAKPQCLIELLITLILVKKYSNYHGKLTHSLYIQIMRGCSKLSKSDNAGQNKLMVLLRLSPIKFLKKNTKKKKKICSAPLSFRVIICAWKLL